MKKVIKHTNIINLMVQLMGVLTGMVTEKIEETINEKLSLNKKHLIEESNNSIKKIASDDLLTQKEVLPILGLKSPTTLWNWRKNGILKPDTYIGRSPRYKRSSIQNFIDNV